VKKNKRRGRKNQYYRLMLKMMKNWDNNNEFNDENDDLDIIKEEDE
jgi:hypothetical protein